MGDDLVFRGSGGGGGQSLLTEYKVELTTNEVFVQNITEP